MRKGTGFLTLVLVLVMGAQAPARATDLVLEDGGGIDVLSVNRVDDREYDAVIVPEALEREVHVRLLLPSGYADQPDVLYPVLYLFHGTSGRASDWTALGDAAAATEGLPLIVVMPDAGIDGNGGGWFTDWVDPTTHLGPSRWETFHIAQLIPWVDANLRTVAAREGRAVAGLSQGGFGSTTYPARHPDTFVSAASFSGAPDIDYNPLVAAGATAVIEAIAVGLNGTAPEVIFGSRATNEINWMGHDPAQLIENLRPIDLWLFTATGAPGPYDPPPPNPGAMGIEGLTNSSTLSFYQRALQVGVDVHMVNYMFGTHSWSYWARDLREYLGPMMYAFSHPPPVSAQVSYASVEPAWSQWGWTVSIDRPAHQEFTWLDEAGPGGFALTGTGEASVTTPAVYEPGAVHQVTMSGASGDVVSSVMADAEGSLGLSVPLGTVPPAVVMGVPPSPTPGSTTTVTIAPV